MKIDLTKINVVETIVASGKWHRQAINCPFLYTRRSTVPGNQLSPAIKHPGDQSSGDQLSGDQTS